MRKLISSSSYLEPEIGFSRAVRIGNTISISGTAPIAVSGGTEGVGDVYRQTTGCLKINVRNPLFLTAEPSGPCGNDGSKFASGNAAGLSAFGFMDGPHGDDIGLHLVFRS